MCFTRSHLHLHFNIGFGYIKYTELNRKQYNNKNSAKFYIFKFDYVRYLCSYGFRHLRRNSGIQLDAHIATFSKFDYGGFVLFCAFKDKFCTFSVFEIFASEKW